MDTCRSSSNNSLRSESTKGSMVRPQPVTESSLLDSVAGFINEVQALNKPNHDSKIQITWASFQRADINDPSLYTEATEVNGNFPPLMLALGYTQGVQIWSIPMTGEAQEVLAWRQGQVKTLKVLPTPESCFGSPDNFAHCRPLVVMVDSTGPGSAFTSASFISLKSGEVVHNIKFNSEVADVLANRRVVIMAFREKLAAFDACTLQPRFTVSTCYPSPGVHVNPIALGERWLAYADQQFVPIHRSLGGMIVDGGQSVTTWGINVGSKLAQGVSKLYSNIFSTKPSSMSSCHPSSLPPMSGTGSNNQQEMQKGIVTILDLLQVCNSTDQDEVNLNDKMAGVIAHFVAHNKAVVAMEFDTNGTLLLTADSVGNYFNLYKIMAHLSGSCYSTVHHLYSLYRGETPGLVQDIAFSPDSRWVAVSTLRGTSHIFPITPYGGQIGVRTHTSTRVVNKLSRFHRSAGLDEYPTTNTTNLGSSGRSSPNPSLGSSPVISKMYVDPSVTGNCPLVIPYPNPYVPPFPAPTLSQPMAQLRQPYIVTLANNAKSSTTKKQSEELIPIRLAVAFASSRASAKQVGNIFHRQNKAKMNESLFVMASHGVLLEYTLETLPDVNNKDNICESSPIKLQVEAFGQWNLTPPKATNDLQPPLSLGNPLMDTMLFPGNDRSFARHPSGNGNEDKWLSQVEIVTHVGPHRRLWMGPQFSFKTLKPAKDGDTIVTQDLDIACRPEQSLPVNMPSTEYLTNQHNVLIECGSASSFELSPRFANRPRLSSQEQFRQDLENEIQEAMSDTIQSREENLDAGLINNKHHPLLSHQHNKNNKGHYIKSKKFGESSSAEEEFFCLTPEDARSISSNTSDRSRNASTASGHQIPDSKIFSVAVEAKAKEVQTGLDSMMVCDVDTDYTGRFAVVSSEKTPKRIKHAPPSKELKIDENMDQDVSNLPEDSCERLLAEALETTVLAETCKKEDVWITSPPNVLEDDNNLNDKNDKNDKDDDDDKFEEMSKQKQIIEDDNEEDDSNDTFEEMTKVNNHCHQDGTEDDEDDNEMTMFKIKEDDNDDIEDDGTNDQQVDNLIDVKTTATSNLASSPLITKSVDLLGNDIVKSIQKANLLYDGPGDQDQGGIGQIFNSGTGSNPCDTFNNACSSEDDLEFKPVTSGRKNKRKQKNQQQSKESNKESDAANSSGAELGSSFADSESEMQEQKSASNTTTEGWLFEADDLDVNKLLSEIIAPTVADNSAPAVVEVQNQVEEKADLEDVFKFDAQSGSSNNDSKTIVNNMSASLNYDDEGSNPSEDNKSNSLSQSMTFGVCTDSKTTTSNSESSVGNSPNPRAASKKKGKSKKKKR